MKVCGIWVGLLFVCFGGDVSEATHRIIAGHETTIQEHPYMVEIQIREQHYCGGTLIHPRMVLTAAHCKVVDTKEYLLRFGTDQRALGGITRKPSDFLIHSGYDDSLQNFHDDVGVITFEEPVPLGDTIQLAKLPEKPLQNGQFVNVSGWGYTIAGDKDSKAEVLNTVELEFIGMDICQTTFKLHTLTKGMLCAGNPEYTKDACTSDSGGPLVANGTIYGITSWGVDCADGSHPGVYTNVYHYKDFILEKMKLVE